MPDIKMSWFVFSSDCLFLCSPVQSGFFFWSVLEFFWNVHATITNIAYFNPQNLQLAGQQLHGALLPQLSFMSILADGMIVQLFTGGVDQWQFKPLLFLGSLTFFIHKMYFQSLLKSIQFSKFYSSFVFPGAAVIAFDWFIWMVQDSAFW